MSTNNSRDGSNPGGKGQGRRNAGLSKTSNEKKTEIKNFKNGNTTNTHNYSSKNRTNTSNASSKKQINNSDMGSPIVKNESHNLIRKICEGIKKHKYDLFVVFISSILIPSFIFVVKLYGNSRELSANLEAVEKRLDNSVNKSIDNLETAQQKMSDELNDIENSEIEAKTRLDDMIEKLNEINSSVNEIRKEVYKPR